MHCLDSQYYHMRFYICHRNIDEVGDFELYYTLFCGKENLLHFIGIICHEISRFPNAPLLSLHGHESSAIREAHLVQFISEIGWSDSITSLFCKVTVRHMMTRTLSLVGH